MDNRVQCYSVGHAATSFHFLLVFSSHQVLFAATQLVCCYIWRRGHSAIVSFSVFNHSGLLVAALPSVYGTNTMRELPTISLVDILRRVAIDLCFLGYGYIIRRLSSGGICGLNDQVVCVYTPFMMVVGNFFLKN